MEALSFTRYHFSLSCLTRVELSGFLATTLRSAFGSGFRRLVCLTQLPHCEPCLLNGTCPYAVVFESKPLSSSDRLEKYNAIPKPYVLALGEPEKLLYDAGEILHFTVTLIGEANKYFPYFVYVFRQLERSGLGKNRRQGEGSYELATVLQETPEGIVPCYIRSEDALRQTSGTFETKRWLETQPDYQKEKLKLNFITPTQIKIDGRLVNQPIFSDIIRTLARRVSNLQYFHSGLAWETDFTKLFERASQIETTLEDTTQHQATRYSRRANRTLSANGFTGTLTFAGDWQEFFPLLQLGQYLHVGKNCVMGMGQYQIEY